MSYTVRCHLRDKVAPTSTCRIFKEIHNNIIHILKIFRILLQMTLSCTLYINFLIIFSLWPWKQYLLCSFSFLLWFLFLIWKVFKLYFVCVIMFDVLATFSVSHQNALCASRMKLLCKWLSSLNNCWDIQSSNIVACKITDFTRKNEVS